MIFFVIFLVISCFPSILYLVWLSTWYWLLILTLILVIITITYSGFIIIRGVHIRYTRRGYLISEDDIRIRYGSIWTECSTVIPMNRLQHVDKEQGVIARHYDLVALTFYTAGNVHELEGLREDEANQIRERVISLAKLDGGDAYCD
ncbi:PH domain-containing protein [Paenibacillus periandrae]|uniref:PH domain-containing protein n=1 Tax=Paenibacillus periandrae TaxID=1761741 RepID=UPI001F08D596|nr:PH domain-containing protein [Paenibacillus periandrae]